MSWQDVLGHDRQFQWFRQQYVSGRLGSSFLFVGPSGIGKRTFALKLAQALLCDETAEGSLIPCETCAACRQVKALTHPDLLTVAREKDGVVSIEQLVGDQAHRMREGLCYDISLKPYYGGKRIAIIDDADYFSEESANALLKTLEEPPPYAMIILIGTNKQRQLPTIRSRCQIIRFAPLRDDLLTQLVLQQGLVQDQQQARQLAALGNGSIEKIAALIGSSMTEFREEFFPRLANAATILPELVSLVNAFVDQAVTDLPGDQKPKRRRKCLRQIIQMTTDFYRQLMRELAGASLHNGDLLAGPVDMAIRNWPGNVETALACINSCLEADVRVSQNANLKTLVEYWLDQLQTFSQTRDPLTLPTL
ncbi:MAG: hypothetical protein VB877_18935 [Pirellulaceae bacterium]